VPAEKIRQAGREKSVEMRHPRIFYYSSPSR
jgi:hypothetical protein